MDHGRIKPGENGRIKWPFGVMKPGDWCTVSLADRSRGQVRNAAHVLADRHGIKLSVRAHGNDATIIRRVDGLDRRTAVQKDYGGARAAIAEAYGMSELEVDGLPLWFTIQPGEMVEVQRQLVAGELPPIQFFDFQGWPKMAIWPERWGFAVERLEDGSKFVDFAKRVERDEAMAYFVANGTS